MISSFLRLLSPFSSVFISFISFSLSLSLSLSLFVSSCSCSSPFFSFSFFFYFFVSGIVISSIFSPLSFRLLDISVFYFSRLPLGSWNELLSYVRRKDLMKAKIFIFLLFLFLSFFRRFERALQFGIYGSIAERLRR